MWLPLLALAFAGKALPEIGPPCTEADAARVGGLHFAAAGVPAASVRVSPVGLCCASWLVAAEDAGGALLGPALALGADCAVHGDLDGPVHGASHGFLAPASNPAAALATAATALVGRSRFDDVVVAEPTPEGTRVWLIRPNAVDALTVAVVTLDAAGAVLSVEDRVEVWRAPAEVVVARWLEGWPGR